MAALIALPIASLVAAGAPVAAGVALAVSLSGREDAYLHGNGPDEPFGPVDSTTVPRLLEERGFKPAGPYKALVVVVGHEGEGRVAYRAFDFKGTSSDRGDWWPASTVKLYAAVAALERVRKWGFTASARVTFDHPEGPVTATVEELVRSALIPSDNQAYDRLVEVVGFDWLNGTFFPRHGFHRTVLLRSYSGRVRDRETGYGVNRDSPPLVLEGGQAVKKVRARHGHGKFECPDLGNCTTLVELADAMRRVVLHESIPAGLRFDLGSRDIRLLRSALGARRERGNGVVDGIQAAFGTRRLKMYHKPGFAYDWFSDVVFVEYPATGERWLVAMAGFPGRGALDDAARHVGALMASGALR